MVETLADGLLFRLFFPNLRIFFSGITGAVKALLNLPMDFLELVYGLRFVHAPKFTPIWTGRKGEKFQTAPLPVSQLGKWDNCCEQGQVGANPIRGTQPASLTTWRFHDTYHEAGKEWSVFRAGDQLRIGASSKRLSLSPSADFRLACDPHHCGIPLTRLA